MKKFFLSLLAAASMASASPYTYTFLDPYAGQNPGSAGSNGDVVGALRRFDIEKVTVNGNGGTFTMSVFMNYGQEGGDTALGAITIGGFPVLNPGDIMLTSGGSNWAIPLVGHDDSTVTAGAMVAGNLYSVNSFLTAAQVLGNPSGSYRPDAYVWGKATGATNQGTGSVTAAGIGGAEIRVDINVVTSNAAIIQALSAGNFELLFAAATCGNDIIIGDAVPTDGQVPEPFTMAMIGSGLVGISALRRKR